MRAGALDRQIIVEKKSSGVDSTFGSPVSGWVPLSGTVAAPEKFWAKLDDYLPSRAEAISFGMNVARVVTRVRMRWRADITAAMRIRVKTDGADDIYQIISGPANVANEGRKTLIEFMCERWSS